jgi:hypothetical protein
VNDKLARHQAREDQGRRRRRSDKVNEFRKFFRQQMGLIKQNANVHVAAEAAEIERHVLTQLLNGARVRLARRSVARWRIVVGERDRSF